MVARSAHEAVLDVARRIDVTLSMCSRHERKNDEMLFAYLNRILKLDRLRLCGMSGATDELMLVATMQNLRRLSKLLPQGPPVTA